MISLELLINLISLQVGLENLSLNQKQVECLDTHLKKQDDVLEKEQNQMLREILEGQKQIIELLSKGGKNNA